MPQPAIMQAYRWRDARPVMRYGSRLAAKNGASGNPFAQRSMAREQPRSGADTISKILVAELTKTCITLTASLAPDILPCV